MLASSQYMTADHSGVLKTLQPIEAQLTATPQLAFIYAASMAKAGISRAVWIAWSLWKWPTLRFPTFMMSWQRHTNGPRVRKMLPGKAAI